MILLMIALLCALALAAQEPTLLPAANDFAGYETATENGERVTWHLDRHAADKAGPVILFLTGSGPAPLFQSYEDGSVGFGVPPELLAYMDRAHVLLVDKPGVPFAAEVDWDEEKGRPVFEAGPGYAAMTRQQLVRRNAAAARAALEVLGEQADGVVVIGSSEGGQYVFELARALPETTHAVAVGGLALPQWYDMVIEARLAAERAEISRREAQARVEALYQTMRDVAARPGSGSVWNGHDYRRWASFGPHAAVEDMLALDIPLLLIHGGADDNAPILNTDYAMIAFLNAGRTNLTYWVYPDYDHFLTEPDPDSPGERINRTQAVYDRLWEWVQETN